MSFLSDESKRVLKGIYKEIKQNIDLSSLEESLQETFEKPDLKAPEIFQNLLEALAESDTNTGCCGYCVEELQVQHGSQFKKGMHISTIGANSTSVLPYKHHMIIKDVIDHGKSTARLKIIHFSKKNSVIKIYEDEKLFDLSSDEFFIVHYRIPKYSPDEVVKRAESLLVTENVEEIGLQSYNFVLRNCEHLATWCVLGEKKSNQVIDKIKELFSKLTKFMGITISTNVIGSLVKGFSMILDELSQLRNQIAPIIDDIADLTLDSTEATGMVFGLVTLIQLIYSILTTGYYVMEKYNSQMCKTCFKRQVSSIWMSFGAITTISVFNFILLQIAVPLMSNQFLIGPLIIVGICSVLLQMAVPSLIRKLQSPFQAEEVAVETESDINPGDILSLVYYGLNHLVVVDNVECTYGSTVQFKGIHYGRQSLLHKKTILEEEFTRNFSELKKLDCQLLPTFSPETVVERARSRIGETKWHLTARSDHFCYWAKVDSAMKIINDFAEVEVHSINDLKTGEVIRFYTYTGIITDIIPSTVQDSRVFEVEVIYYGIYKRCRKRVFSVDLNKQYAEILKYHPQKSYPNNVRVERAEKLMNSTCEWWTRWGFLDYCVVKNGNEYDEQNNIY